MTFQFRVVGVEGFGAVGLGFFGGWRRPWG